MPFAEVSFEDRLKTQFQVHVAQPRMAGGGAEGVCRGFQFADQNVVFQPAQQLFAEALTGVVRMRAEPANMRQAHRPRYCAPRETQGDRSDHSLVIKQRKHRMIVEMLRHACQIGGGSIKLNPERFNGRVGGQHQRQIIVFIIQRQTPEMVRHNPCSSGELR